MSNDPHGHHHDHDHDHDHDGHHGHDHHAPPQPDDKVHSYYQILGIALKELLIEKGVVTADEVRAAMEARDSITPANGAKVVARAWADPGFHERLIADANTAIRELGFQTATTQLVALQNTPDVHNVVVCTLCSCYPRDLLGLPPSWYKSRAYRARIVREPRAVLEEFGLEVPASQEVRVHDSTADLRYLVVPQRPPGTEAMDEEALAALVTRDAMIGVAVARPPNP
ncbi:MAG: Low-molecular weight cobalt-containing nitrile hydratase subunit alpha [Hyphomicrobiales bacterium]|nr:Low-molecular weight cobalt-containing nitrile hydratase subunit alpha [Hyphomicrobiales bacterium]